MVHISEIAHTYVSNIRDHLKEGQAVAVKVVGVDGEGRINLSIKKATENPRPAAPAYAGAPRRALPREPLTFEDKIKQFMQDSESKMSDLKQHTDKRGARRRGR
jgi:S1 RNA binding domain protein